MFISYRVNGISHWIDQAEKLPSSIRKATIAPSIVPNKQIKDASDSGLS